LDQSRARLLVERDKRVRPGKDDKVLVSWNALMIDTLARTGAAFDEPRYIEAATAAANFILQNMVTPQGRLLHTWRLGQAKFDAYLDDYTYFINALVTLYETAFDENWLDHAVRLADTVLTRFADAVEGGFFFTADDQEQLIARNKDMHDSSVPSGNSMAAYALLRLGKLSGRSHYVEAAQRTLQAGINVMEQSPAAAGHMLMALDMYLGPTPEIAILADRTDAATIDAVRNLRKRFLPNYVLAWRGPDGHGSSPHLSAMFLDKQAQVPQPTVYICQNFTCQAPDNGLDGAIAAWDRLILEQDSAAIPTADEKPSAP
jgi:uncharacterized protein YyaL (SSP411 family)